MTEITETGCCPRFDPKPWDEKTFEWENKKFIRGKVKTFMYMPLNFGGAISKLMKMVEGSSAKTPDSLCLSDHTSKWNMDIYLAVDKEIVGAENVALSGKFLSKVYEGDFREIGKWGDDFKKYLASKDLKIKSSANSGREPSTGSGREKWYMWYTTCPKCAKVYGKNYVVTIAELA
ncbi:MAG: hydrolase [Patescibacteria group bacterium]|jgi:hypothetical protein